MLPFRDLKKREKDNNPVRAGIIGAGWLGSGVLYRMARTPGMMPAVVSNRTPQKAAAALLRAGIPASSIRLCETMVQARAALERGDYVVTPLSLLPHEFPEIEIVVETTGDVLLGAEAALKSIEARKHFVAANPETQGTVGFILKQKAQDAGVVYSDIDGDQGGILINLYDYCRGIGFEPVVAGNCKGVMKRYATPETQAAYAKEYGIQPWIAAAAADGTKLNFEMCIVANATGMLPVKPGMTGPETTLETLLPDFEKRGLLDKGPIVEYTMGIPTGVFIIARSVDPVVRGEMRYLKMGDGPHYLFYHARVFCHYDAVPAIAEAALYGHETVSPRGEPVAEMAAYAKRGLASGREIDGIGGYDVYGQVVSSKQASREELLPMGLAAFARLVRNVSKDEPVTLRDIEWTASNLLTDLWQEQRGLLAAARPAAVKAVSQV